MEVNSVVQDSVFFTALLKDPAVILLTIGDHPAETYKVETAGVFHSSCPFGGRTGIVRLSIVRHDTIVAFGFGEKIVDTPVNGLTNYNAWVGGVDDIEQ